MTVRILICLLSFIVYTNAAALESAYTASGVEVEVFGKGNSSILQIREPTKELATLTINRDATVLPASQPINLEIIGEINGVALILTDTYPSKPRGMSYCQAGEERFLRIISIAKHPPRESLKLKLESCVNSIELNSSGITWDSKASTLKLDWLPGSTQLGQDEQKTIVIGPNGEPMDLH